MDITAQASIRKNMCKPALRGCVLDSRVIPKLKSRSANPLTTEYPNSCDGNKRSPRFNRDRFLSTLTFESSLLTNGLSQEPDLNFFAL